MIASTGKHDPGWSLYQNNDTGLHWNMTMKTKVRPAAQVSAAAAVYMIRRWTLCRVTRNKNAAMDIFVSIIVVPYVISLAYVSYLVVSILGLGS